jgi:hypothetical protein
MSLARKSCTTGQPNLAASGVGVTELQGGHAVLVINCLTVAADQVQRHRVPRQHVGQGIGEVVTEGHVGTRDRADVGQMLRGERSTQLGRHWHGLERKQLEAQWSGCDAAERHVESVHRSPGHQAGDVAHGEARDLR